MQWIWDESYFDDQGAQVNYGHNSVEVLHNCFGRNDAKGLVVAMIIEKKLIIRTTTSASKLRNHAELFGSQRTVSPKAAGYFTIDWIKRKVSVFNESNAFGDFPAEVIEVIQQELQKRIKQ